jgi:hypothetical protein
MECLERVTVLAKRVYWSSFRCAVIKTVNHGKVRTKREYILRFDFRMEAALSCFSLYTKIAEQFGLRFPRILVLLISPATSQSNLGFIQFPP